MVTQSEITWKKIIEGDQSISFKSLYKVLPTKGKLAWEYNPFRNYRLSQDMYEYEGILYTADKLISILGGKLNKTTFCDTDSLLCLNEDSIKNEDVKDIYNKLKNYINTEEEINLNQIFPKLLNNKNTEKLQLLFDNAKNSIQLYINEIFKQKNITKHQQFELVDFCTNELSFNLEHPVNIIPTYSYDGSVDLILNDGYNSPKLINSRFSATGLDTYEVCNRKGDNDTNIYDQGNQFDVDTSLFKKTISIPKLEYLGDFPGGNLKIGNYFFYFKYADADGNETSFVTESGLVSVFKGFNTPSAITTGVENENSFKYIQFKLSNIDAGYSYVNVYYTKATSAINQNMVTQAFKINNKYLINYFENSCKILINGWEEVTEIPMSEINLDQETINCAKTQCINSNMLFLANIQKNNIDYNKLQDLSLRFLPYANEEVYPVDMDSSYNIRSSEKGYFSSKFIYNKTGYWASEYYRLGIVYIMKDGSLSPVFNIRGRENLKVFSQENATDFSKISNRANYCDLQQYSYFGINTPITYDEKTNLISIQADLELNDGQKEEFLNGTIDEELLKNSVIGNESICYENVKGVVSIDKNQPDTNFIHSFDIRTSYEVINELKKYVKGFYFVRQKRMPTILGQGITIGIDKEGRVPCLPTADGIANIDYNNTYVETENMNYGSVHYISEGFMGRYKYELKPDSTNFWTILGLGLLFVVSVVASIFTAGASLVISGIVATNISLSTLAIIGGAMAGAVLIGAIATSAAQRANREDPDAVPFLGKNQPIPTGLHREELDSSRLLDAEYKDRIILKDNKYTEIGGLIMPDFDVNPAYFNQLFTGDEFKLENTKSQSSLVSLNIGYFINKNREFYVPIYQDFNENKIYSVKLNSLSDERSSCAIDDKIFKRRAGDFSSAYKVIQIGTKYTGEDFTINSDLVRGEYGPYIAMTGFDDVASLTVNVRIPGFDYDRQQEYMEIRMNDHSEYYAITDRIDIKSEGFKKDALGQITDKNFQIACYRGDCYLCQFTHRMLRNFNDATAPYNETIVDPKTWKLNFDKVEHDKNAKINLGDVNAVELGHWLTFRVRSSYNLNIRTIDGSHLEEFLGCGHERAYYPYHPQSTDGTYKIPEAYCYNLGFSKSVSDRVNFEVPDIPWHKNWYGTRIMYSAINAMDSYQNGFRSFSQTSYMDYTREYGEIVKLISMDYDQNPGILIIFEHGIGYVGVNEKAVAAQAASGNVFITSNNVLPKTPRIISDCYGSQWADSIIKIPEKQGQANNPVVFGVDTVAKKIWKVSGSSIECISDFKVQEFLNNNITLGEREKTPILGIRNVKSFYNAFKQEVMFTFYDNLNTVEEKVWNLCYSTISGGSGFTTFYSWVPSYMENIQNIPFSFNRNTSKWIAQLGQSHEQNAFSKGITLTTNVYNNNFQSQQSIEYTHYYTTVEGKQHSVICYLDYKPGLLGVLNIDQNLIHKNGNSDYAVIYNLQRDIYKNHELFEIKKLCSIKNSDIKNRVSNEHRPANEDIEFPVYGVFFKMKEASSLKTALGEVNIGSNEQRLSEEVIYKSIVKESYFAELYYRNIAGNSYSDYDDFKVSKEEYPYKFKQYYDENSNDSNRESINKDLNTLNYFEFVQKYKLPIFKNREGKRLCLKHPFNKTNIVQLLNIKATICCYIPNTSLSRADFYNINKINLKEENLNNSENSILNNLRWVGYGNYESQVAVCPKWNLQFLSTDFWKHGQAGLIDICDEIKPTYWYGEQHPFEFEFIVNEHPDVHKIFNNLEIIANKAKPHSFHFEIIGEAYDFAKDKANMYFRQEARKALYQYNGQDVTYNPKFVKISPKQNKKSSELISKFYFRQDTLNDVYDTYLHLNNGGNYDFNGIYESWLTADIKCDFRHLSGAELVWYDTRNEFRIWQHQPAIILNDLSQDTAISLQKANCSYLEDKWNVQINPLLICYKNEYRNGNIYEESCSTWAKSPSGVKLPPINIINVKPLGTRNEIHIPGENGTSEGKENSLYNLYDLDAWNHNKWDPLDTSNWLEDSNIYNTNFGMNQNLVETPLRDRFIKIRIRYSGEELAIIDLVRTIYEVSYT